MNGGLKARMSGLYRGWAVVDFFALWSCGVSGVVGL